MTAKQISVFLENKPGQLTEFARLLDHNGINMHALSVADAKDFGILRIIVDDSYKTACVLKDAGYVFSITKVLAIEIPDKPGSLVYTYAFTSKKEDSAYMIFKVADNEKAIEVLDKEGIKPVCQSEMSELFTR